MTQDRIGKLHAAAKIIEVDGDEGINSATNLVGEDVAMALLIAHLRRNRGSTETYPSRDGIEEEVNDVLKQRGLLH